MWATITRERGRVHFQLDGRPLLVGSRIELFVSVRMGDGTFSENDWHAARVASPYSTFLLFFDEYLPAVVLMEGMQARWERTEPHGQ